MSRQDANAAFALTSFLYGGNAAYVEDLYARYEADPRSVDAEWQNFFASLKDNAADVAHMARGASWRTPDWPQPPRGELITSGPYALVKHPLYTGVALLVLPAIGFLLNTRLGAAIGIIMYRASRRFSPDEEADLANAFGTTWESYCQTVKIAWI